MHVDHLALALAVTIRHDGHVGVADDLTDPAGLTCWVREHAQELGQYGFGPAVAVPGGAVPAGPASGVAGSGDGDPHPAEVRSAGRAFTADAGALDAVVAVRTAIRALFARAVLPGPPSKADAGRLPDAGAALERLNAASARVPVTHRLRWPADGPPVADYGVPGDPAPAELLAAALARAAVGFLAGPDLVRLRACPAPRCVRYFVQAHARQEWCKPSCGNRARVARHHARRREQAAQDPA
jgi:predicted RNA-binding Zn ribbon-like protein